MQRKDKVKHQRITGGIETSYRNISNNNPNIRPARRGSVWIIPIAIVLVILLNYLTSIITDYLKVPFFLDTWATSVAVMTVGLMGGIIGGVLYNLIMAFTVWGSESWVWAFSSIWVAIITYILWKKNCFDIGNPLRVLCSGIIIGITNTIVAMAIRMIALGGMPTYPGTAPVYSAFLALTGSAFLASFSEILITELADKIVAAFIAAIVISKIPGWFRTMTAGRHKIAIEAERE